MVTDIQAFLNSTNDLILIAIVILLFFGANKIPEMMRGLGQGMREMKKGISGDEPARPDDEEREARLRAEIEEEVHRRLDAERRSAEKG